MRSASTLVSSAPDAFFARVRTLGRKLNPAYFRKQKIHWPNIARDLAAFGRLAYVMTVRHPELARPFWATIYDVLRHHPIAIEGVVRNISHYVHLYPFSLYVLRTVDGRLAEIDAGGWSDIDRPALPALNDVRVAAVA